MRCLSLEFRAVVLRFELDASQETFVISHRVRSTVARSPFALPNE